jgi:hypothetical protein
VRLCFLSTGKKHGPHAAERLACIGNFLADTKATRAQKPIDHSRD